MAGRILVGTCSWTDKSLIDCGRFYPPEAKTAEQRLRFYASRFPIVEVDSTFYGLPSERNAGLWTERPPPPPGQRRQAGGGALSISPLVPPRTPERGVHHRGERAPAPVPGGGGVPERPLVRRADPPRPP